MLIAGKTKHEMESMISQAKSARGLQGPPPRTRKEYELSVQLTSSISFTRFHTCPDDWAIGRTRGNQALDPSRVNPPSGASGAGESALEQC